MHMELNLIKQEMQCFFFLFKSGKILADILFDKRKKYFNFSRGHTLEKSLRNKYIIVKWVDFHLIWVCVADMCIKIRKYIF